MISDIYKKNNILEENATVSRFPSCTAGEEQLRSTARLTRCRERLLAYVGMTSEQGGLPSDTFLTGMHLAVVIGSAQILLISNEPIVL